MVLAGLHPRPARRQDQAGEPDVAAEPGRRRQVVVAESLAGEPRAGGGDAGVVRGKAVVGTADRPFPASCCLEALRRAPGARGAPPPAAKPLALVAGPAAPGPGAAEPGGPSDAMARQHRTPSVAEKGSPD